MSEKRNFSRTSIRAFLILWMSGIGICTLVLSAFLIASTNFLQKMTGQIYNDSWAIEAIRELQSSVLDEHRDDILAQTAGNRETYIQRRNEKLAHGEQIIKELLRTVTSDKEKILYPQMQESFLELKNAELGKPGASYAATSTLVDNLLQSISAFEEENKRQMDSSLVVSARMDRFVNRATAALIAVIFIIMIGGSIALINRIVQPTFSLIKAADNFGKGYFSAKTRVYRDDELGTLARTFNKMADSISNAQQERVNFIAAIAHDLKNPLTVVGAASYRLLKKGPVTEDQKQWLGRIIQQIERVDVMIGDLLDSVSIEAGNLELRKTRVDLNELLSEQAGSQDECCETHKIIYEESGRCIVDGDKRLLERVFANLITNAVKYSPEKSTVTLKVEKRDNNAFITVRDEGEGIPPDDLEDIFLPFRRLARTQGMAQGFGLGLYSVKQIVNHHGGEIRIESEIQIGTTVEIRLPLARREDDTPDKKEIT